MSYGPWTRNPYEHDESPLEDEDRSPCACGDPRCWIDHHDPTNVYRGGQWYAEGCAERDPVLAREREQASRADVSRDDDFNRIRR